MLKYMCFKGLFIWRTITKMSTLYTDYATGKDSCLLCDYYLRRHWNSFNITSLWE